MQSVRVENIPFCRLYTNRLRPFQSSYSNQHQPPLPLLIGDMRCSTSHSLAVGACTDFCVFLSSFKYFHTADTFAALVRAYIWSCHVIVRYILFGLFAYLAKHRKSFFVVVASFGASLILKNLDNQIQVHQKNRISWKSLFLFIIIVYYWVHRNEHTFQKHEISV